MNSHDITRMVNAGAFSKRAVPTIATLANDGANIHGIAEDVRARLNATDNRKPDDSHPHGYASLIDERRVLLAIERVIDAAGY